MQKRIKLCNPWMSETQKAPEEEKFLRQAKALTSTPSCNSTWWNAYKRTLQQHFHNFHEKLWPLRMAIFAHDKTKWFFLSKMVAIKHLKGKEISSFPISLRKSWDICKAGERLMRVARKLKRWYSIIENWFLFSSSLGREYYGWPQKSPFGGQGVDIRMSVPRISA